MPSPVKAEVFLDMPRNRSLVKWK